MLIHRLSAALTVYAFGLFFSLALFAESIDKFQAVQERTAFFIITGSFFLTIGVYIFNMLRFVFHPPSLHSLALKVEYKHPELLDSFIASLEKESTPHHQRSIIEHALLERTAENIKKLNLKEDLTPVSLKLAHILFLAVIFAIMGALSVQSNLLKKAVTYATDPHGGININPGTTEVAIHSDVHIKAEILRGEQQASINYRKDGKQMAFDMMQRDKSFHFTFYDITEPISYRIKTPSLVSKKYAIRPFTPPQIKNLIYTSTPPEYTGKEKTKRDHLEDGAEIQGSEIQISIETGAASASLILNKEQIPFGKTDAKSFTATFILEDKTDIAVLLKDSESRTTKTPLYTIDAIKDQPPVIDVIEPGGDAVLPPEEGLLLRARAADDFGISDVHVTYAVSGGTRRSIPLFHKKETDQLHPDVTCEQMLNSNSLGAVPGDVISLIVTAVDNKEPEPQSARSEVFFIEIREKIEPQNMPGSPGEKKEVDIAPLISEAKRLIRFSYDIVSSPFLEDIEERKHELGTGLSDLDNEAGKLLKKIVDNEDLLNLLMTEVDPSTLPEPLMLIQSARAEWTIAEHAVKSDLVEKSIPSQERALSRLISLAQLLMKNAASSQSSSGKKSSDQPPESNEQQQKTSSMKEQLEALKEAVRKVNRMIGEQESLNQGLKRGTRTALSPAEKAQLAERRNALMNQAEALSEELQKSNFPGDVIRDIDKAANSMRETGRRIKQDNMDQAHKSGIRTQNHLRDAADSLNSLFRKLSAGKLNALTRQAQQLADAQRSLAKASGSLTPDQKAQAEQLKKQQKQLGKITQDMLKQGATAASELQDNFPEASEALVKALQQMREKNLQGKQKRAGNALNYGKFGRAEQYQKEAANLLQKLSSDMGKASEHLPKLSNREIMEAMRKLNQAQQQMQQAAKLSREERAGRMEKIGRTTADMLDALARDLDNADMQSLASMMRLNHQSTNEQDQFLKGMQILENARLLLTRELMKHNLEQKLKRNRSVAPPPEQYRGLVEEYFKSLSEED